MLPSSQTRFASIVAALVCSIITIGFSIAPAVSPLAGTVA
jgi:hypothetical protein